MQLQGAPFLRTLTWARRRAVAGRAIFVVNEWAKPRPGFVHQRAQRGWVVPLGGGMAVCKRTVVVISQMRRLLPEAVTPVDLLLLQSWHRYPHVSVFGF